MKAAGPIEIFGWWIKKHNLRYSEHLGDGNTASLIEVVESQPYGN